MTVLQVSPDGLAGTGSGGMQRSPLGRRVRAVVPAPFVSGGRAAARGIGTATARWRPMPDYLIIGAKKGGTTSVANWLAGHPQVMGMVPRLQSAKSPHYFDINYWRGPAWYASHFPTTRARAMRAARLGATPVCGESSPYYLFHPWAGERIAATLPDARLIAILRDPVSRAYSHYWDSRARCQDDLPTFEAAVDAEAERLGRVDEDVLRDPRAYDRHHDHHGYLARGEYADQLDRLHRHVPAANVLVLTSDDLKNDAASSFRRVESFLGLRHHHIDLSPRNVRTGYPPIDPGTRDRLRAHFEPHNRALEVLLGRRLDW